MGTRPIIEIVDDRPHGLGAMRDALDRRFGGDYRVVAHISAGAALDDLSRARRDGDEVALVIADQWMPEMEGRELLGRVYDLHPDAQRALLVGWGDVRASDIILQGCALKELDNYLLKPWEPAEVHLYPVIEDFLSAWARTHMPRLELVRVVGEHTSPRVAELRDVLERSGVPYGAYTLESELGRRLLADARIDRARLPAIVLFDGRVLQHPSNAELADALGVAAPEDLTCDVAIVGAGPGGLAAAVYAASEGLRTVVVEREAIGGQAAASTLVRNFLGFPRGISGVELTQRAYQQAWLFGAHYVLARNVIGLRADGARRIISLDDGREVSARAVVIATGVTYRHLEEPRIARFERLGVLHTAGADIATALAGQDVVVYGGGNSAGQAVVHLARRARRVIHAVRGPALAASMSAYLIDDIARLRNVELRLDTEVVDADGERFLERITLRHRPSGAEHVVGTSALFVMIGAVPHTDWLRGALDCDTGGYVVTGSDLSTTLPGVFALGDVRRGSTKRIASAVGEAAVAIRSVQDYLIGG